MSEERPAQESRVPADADADEAVPLGPEDRERPDRERQHPAGAEHERGGRRRPEQNVDDVADGAWEAEATFGEGATGPSHSRAAGDDDVDPVVHRGE